MRALDLKPGTSGYSLLNSTFRGSILRSLVRNSSRQISEFPVSYDRRTFAREIPHLHQPYRSKIRIIQQSRWRNHVAKNSRTKKGRTSGFSWENDGTQRAVLSAEAICKVRSLSQPQRAANGSGWRIVACDLGRSIRNHSFRFPPRVVPISSRAQP